MRPERPPEHCMLRSLEVKVRAPQSIRHTKTLSPTQEDAYMPKQLTYSSHIPSSCSTRARSHYLGPSLLHPACATTLPPSLSHPPPLPLRCILEVLILFKRLSPQLLGQYSQLHQPAKAFVAQKTRKSQYLRLLNMMGIGSVTAKFAKP